jgi:hypothetical protein
MHFVQPPFILQTMFYARIRQPGNIDFRHLGEMSPGLKPPSLLYRRVGSDVSFTEEKSLWRTYVPICPIAACPSGKLPAQLRQAG